MASPASSRRRTPRGQGAALRERLLEEATQLIDEQGSAAQLSIRAVTKRAGVSPMAFYLHFEDLGSLIRAVVDRGFLRFLDAVSKAAAGEADPRRSMEVMGLAYLRFAREQPALYTVIFGRVWPAGDRPPTPEEQAEWKADPGSPSRQAFDALVTGVARCLPPERVESDATPIALGLWSALHGFALLREARGSADWPSDDEYVRMLTARWLP